MIASLVWTAAAFALAVLYDEPSTKPTVLSGFGNRPGHAADLFGGPAVDRLLLSTTLTLLGSAVVGIYSFIHAMLCFQAGLGERLLKSSLVALIGAVVTAGFELVFVVVLPVTFR
jgi:hypothetical protein